MKTTALRPTAVAGLVLGGLAVGSVIAPSLATADGGSGDDGTDKQISVVVIGATPGSTSSGAASTPSMSASASATVPPTSRPSPSPTGRPPSPDGDRPAGEDGFLFVGDLHCDYLFSLNPLGGSMKLSFMVRNEYSKPVDGSARLWLTNVFGSMIGVPATAAVPELRPHESRQVSATIDGVAQWTFLTAHATFTPPPGLGGPVVLTVVREARPFVFPWVLVPGAAVGAAGVGSRWLWLRAVRRPVGVETVARSELE